MNTRAAPEEPEPDRHHARHRAALEGGLRAGLKFDFSAAAATRTLPCTASIMAPIQARRIARDGVNGMALEMPMVTKLAAAVLETP